jgi:hypothetical protein
VPSGDRGSTGQGSNDSAKRGLPAPSAMLPPRPVLASAILLVGGLGWSLASAPPPVAELSEAARWEGQTVALQGWATEVRGGADATRFLLVDGAHSLQVRVAAGAGAAPGFAAGDRVEAAGRLSRWQGELRLEVEDPAGVRRTEGPAASSPTLEDVAAAPQAWQGRLILLRGVVADGRLTEGTRSVALGDGAWPGEGPVQARGLLRWDGGCLCHRLDAREVWPWTP